MGASEDTVQRALPYPTGKAAGKGGNRRLGDSTRRVPGAERGPGGAEGGPGGPTASPKPSQHPQRARKPAPRQPSLFPSTLKAPFHTRSGSGTEISLGNAWGPGNRARPALTSPLHQHLPHLPHPGRDPRICRATGGPPSWPSLDGKRGGGSSQSHHPGTPRAARANAVWQHRRSRFLVRKRLNQGESMGKRVPGGNGVASGPEGNQAGLVDRVKSSEQRFC